MPKWMRDIVIEECLDHEMGIPELKAKYIEERGYLGGYTLHSDPGEICVVYGVGQWFGTANELNTLLHETAHWIVGPEPQSEDGHTPKFYSELTRLVLKYGSDIEAFLADESNYTGADRVYEGVSLFHSTYNS